MGLALLLVRRRDGRRLVRWPRAGVLGVECSKILELLPGGKEQLLSAGVGWKEGLGHRR